MSPRMLPGMWVLAVGAVVVVLVLAEAIRQRRKYGHPSGKPGLAGAGLLEAQRLLQADRHVEVLAAQALKSDVQDAEQDEAGVGRKPGKGGGVPDTRAPG